MTDLYFRGRLLATRGKWAEVRQIFEEIEGRLQNSPYQTVGYPAECKYWIARALSEQGDKEQALKLVREAIQMSRNRDSDKEIEGHIDSFDDVKGWMIKLHEQLMEQLQSSN